MNIPWRVVFMYGNSNETFLKYKYHISLKFPGANWPESQCWNCILITVFYYSRKEQWGTPTVPVLWITWEVWSTTWTTWCAAQVTPRTIWKVKKFIYFPCFGDMFRRAASNVIIRGISSVQNMIFFPRSVKYTDVQSHTHKHTHTHTHTHRLWSI